MCKHKTNIIKDRQSYMGGKVRFPSFLWSAPDFERAPEYDRPEFNTEGYFIKSVEYKGEVTWVFAHVGLPDGASSESPAPGIVLVHGGGGTAYCDWVQYWTERGYAAIAIDTEGRVPEREANLTSPVAPTKESPKHSGPINSQMNDGKDEIGEQWCYQAVAAVIAANSFLSSLKEVDGERVGLTGISWGSVLATNAACYDDRFAFCIPVYGGKGMTGTKGICGKIYDDNPKSSQLWDCLEPLEECRTPFLFINWNADTYFLIDATTKCVNAAQNGEMVLIDDLIHGHPQGARIAEADAFADAAVKGRKRGLKKVSYGVENTVACVVGASSPAEGWIYQAAEDVITTDTVWERSSMELRDGKFTFTLADSTKKYYATVSDGDGIRYSLPVVTVTK